MSDKNKIVAAVQMASGPNVKGNLHEAEKLIAQAVETGASLVVLPENFAFMGSGESEKLSVAEKPGDGPMQAFLAEQASRHGIWLVGGTVPLTCSEAGKVRAASLVFTEQGEVAGRYDKMHLFDVVIPENNERYTESEAIQPGEAPFSLDSPFGRLGLSVCYDLRFPEFFRNESAQGMDIIIVPSAFTAQTGRAHWEALLRARAIENLSFVIAAAQGGFHVSGRETYGHSMIIDPWGNILNSLAKGPGVVTAEISLEQLEQTRRAFPVLAHRRIFCKVS